MKSAGHGWKRKHQWGHASTDCFFLDPLTGRVCKMSTVWSPQIWNKPAPGNPLSIPLVSSPAKCQWEKKDRGGGRRRRGGSVPCHMPAEAKSRESASPLTWGQSSPSSGVISVSLWTTTLVTDMSGCCSLASLIAWARAYPQEVTEGQRQKGGGTCMISSEVETYELDLSTSFTNEVQWLQKELYAAYWKVNSENSLDRMMD